MRKANFISKMNMNNMNGNNEDKKAIEIKDQIQVAAVRSEDE